MNTLLYIYMINVRRINTQLFLASTKKIIDKDIYNYNTKKNQEEINQTKKNKMNFISTIKKSFFNISKKNSRISCDLSSLSQGYVFYKLSQTQVINKYHLRSVLKYRRTSLFLKDILKNFFRTQRILHCESRHNKFRNFGINEWKNRLKGYYQYNLSQTIWARLVSQKWRNRVNERRRAQNQDSKKLGSYENEKDQLIHYEKENDSRMESLQNQKKKFKKHYRYDLLSHKYINSNYESKKDFYIYGSFLQINENRKIPYNYNTNKLESFYVLEDISINDYLGEDYFIETEKNPDRKYFDWEILHFCLIKKSNIKAWANMDTGADSYQNKIEIVDKIEKKDLFYFPIHQEINLSNKKKKNFDWMGMNEEILNHPISNFELWFFPELLLLFDAYKIKTWVMPTKLLLLNLNRNKNINGKEGKEKSDLFISSNKKKFLELENRNQKELLGQGDLGSVLPKQQKYLEKNYVRLDIQKDKKKKQNTELWLDFFLKRYLIFQFRWNYPLNQRIINNMKVYCLLLRLINTKKKFLSFIQRGEMSMNVMLSQKDQTFIELGKRGILIIEPIRLSIKWNGKSIMYQTIGISLVHKSKQQTNQRYREKRYIDKNSFDKSIARYENILGDWSENHYDLLVPENLLSLRRRRELRILIYFHFKNGNALDRNLVFWNGNNNVRNCNQFWDEDKDINRDKFINMKLKFFLWSNYRLEDLACMNRYWFDTNNGSRFSMSRIHMYQRLKIC
ncbi:hypothetical protein NE237_006938 [Protea cynaroides]|uniref:Ycf1 n=1 Tax=Protea cynaroides TaxID=273540 RepID=A0A9Q0KP45_9MAGN|nr:hypothetical protein NE237_006938 [Protea cynaroides]